MTTKEEFEEYFFTHSNGETAKHFKVCTTTVRKWARKFNTKRKCSRYKDMPNAFLSDEQKSIIVGSMLGDGTLGKVVGNEQSYYRELHGISQKDYIEWKFNALNPFAVRMRECVNNKIYRAMFFHTIRHPIFTELEAEWYLRDGSRYVLKNKRRVKVVPNSIRLTPLSVAIWYLDDGWRPKRDNQFYFSTHGFSVDDCDLLVAELCRLGVSSNIRLRTKNQLPEIAVPASSKLNFLDLVESHIPCRCMEYKLFG